MAALLLQRGASLDTGGRSALDIAIYQVIYYIMIYHVIIYYNTIYLQGSPAMVELLLDSGANMEQRDARGVRPLDRVIGFGNGAVVSVFLRAGAKLGPGTWIMAAEKPDIQ